MNVRFFAGTRAQYDSLPAPRNPLGLYFCADTQELFWADRLLTDGMRVVDKFTDLPEPTKAADGVVYYVNETRNGYVVPHGTNKWLQTIYAPALDVSSVPESEIYNTVTTVGAVRDIEAKIYGIIDKLDERIANIEIVGPGSNTPSSGSASGIQSITFAGYELEEIGGHYVIDRRCAREALGIKLPEGYGDKEIEIVTKEYVAEKIAEAAFGDVNIDHLVTQDELAQAIAALNIPKVPTKVSELENDVGYLTQHQDLSDYAKKSEIPNIEGLASEDFVRSEIAKAGLNGSEVTEEDLSNLLTNYYTKTDIDNKFTELDIPSIEGLATEEFVNNAIASVEAPGAELYKVDFNAPNFMEAAEAYRAGKVLVLANAAPDVNSYALMNYVGDKYITFTKFLMSRSETYGAFNTYYLSSDNTWEVSKEVKLNKVEINPDGSLQVGKQVLEIPSTEGLATKQELANYVTNEYITQQQFVTNDYITENYTTTEQLEQTFITKEGAAQDFVTTEALEEKQFITAAEAEDKIEVIVKEVVKEVVTPNSLNYETF